MFFCSFVSKKNGVRKTFILFRRLIYVNARFGKGERIDDDVQTCRGLCLCIWGERWS